MNPGEVWHLDDDSRRLVLSPATYNASALGRVITAVVGATPTGFDPFAIHSPWGTVYADRVAMHPRAWLLAPVGRISHDALSEVRAHLRFLLG